LCDRILDFFRSKGLKVTANKLEDGYIIFLSDATKGTLKVKIVGKPDDFIVELYTESHYDSFSHLGPLVSIFGGGAFLLKKIKNEEFLMKIEEDFWKYIEEILTFLRNSKNRRF